MSAPWATPKSTSGTTTEAPILWRHPDPANTNLARFMRHVSQKHTGLKLETYPALYKWSVDDVSTFWGDVWEFCGIRASQQYDRVLPLPLLPPPSSSSGPVSSENGAGSGGTAAPAPTPAAIPAMYPRPDFFEGARLNFAENLLFPTTLTEGANVIVDDTAVAILTVTERYTGNGEGLRETTWAQLREDVRRCANALRAAGLQKGDVVAGFVSNHVESVVAMLAAASIGAIWTAISPDNGVSAVLDRLAQIGPKVLFADDGVVYNGKAWPSTDKTVEIVTALVAAAAAGDKKEKGGLELVVVIGTLPKTDAATTATGQGIEELKGKVGRVETWDGFLDGSGGGALQDEPLRFEQLPPSHPLYILYSSGTTGLPKAIVHTAAGTLLQHKKEHILHCSISSRSRMLYYTTTSWMMWHWSVSALAAGASLVLYSGSPFKPHGHLSLPRLLSQLRVTHFGTSAAYLVTLEANNVRPVEDPTLDLSPLEAIYSTASPLPPSTFSFVYEAFPKTINLGSITGGTDIISLFGAPCPLLPVRVGEIQCAGLGMAIQVVDSASDADDPRPVDPLEAPGDLVCVKPFPCQPLTFFGPGGDEKYRAAYFERFPGIWAHGDFVSISPSGGLTMLGRSDGVLKPSGVRFGSAEIYNILTRFFAPTIADAVCIGRRRPNIDTDETVCLFLVMQPGVAFIRGTTDKEIRDVIKTQLSPRHVPAVIEECGPDGVPKTGNGKKIEVAVKQILSGLPVRTNASVANPEALEWFRDWATKN